MKRDGIWPTTAGSFVNLLNEQNKILRFFRDLNEAGRSLSSLFERSSFSNVSAWSRISASGTCFSPSPRRSSSLAPAIPGEASFSNKLLPFPSL
eukprot:CAMPEP_0194673600 /NCGR_PEP_ID=MMETSP0295-20121207/7156_1 /TAXON_ID=39354 /ORGANISM="Heterosigma akashiwo, Strain CCMP2393" /LENGTH=93 /DNA_ID=CAMNT_0039557569 /DNA_START=262 /DNA_END=543 /DNA_ORIENTATION=-